MSYLTKSIAQGDPFLQELVERMKNARSLALLILAALQLGRAVAVKVAEEVLNERGQEATEWSACPKCGKKLESKGLELREMITLIGVVKWWRRSGAVRVVDGSESVPEVDLVMGARGRTQSDGAVECPTGGPGARHLASRGGHGGQYSGIASPDWGRWGDGSLPTGRGKSQG